MLPATNLLDLQVFPRAYIKNKISKCLLNINVANALCYDNFFYCAFVPNSAFPQEKHKPYSPFFSFFKDGMVGHFQAIVSKDSASHVLFSNTQFNSQQHIPVHIIRQYVNHGGQAELLFIIVLHMKNSLQIPKIATYLKSEYATKGCKSTWMSLS